MYVYMDSQGNYPKYPGDAKIFFPNWDDYDNPPGGWRLVNDVEPPQILSTQTLIENDPIEKNGELFRSFSVREMTQEELDAHNYEAMGLKTWLHPSIVIE